MTQIREFLKGKKTYISAAALALVAIAGFWFGYVDGTSAAGMLTTAGALAGLGAKSNRAAQDILVTLGNVRDAQEAARVTGKPVDAKQLAQETAKHLAPEIIQAIASGAVQLQPVPAADTSTIRGQEITETGTPWQQGNQAK